MEQKIPSNSDFSSQLRVNRRTTSNDKCQDIVASQLIFLDYFQESDDFCICILVPILCFSQNGVLHIKYFSNKNDLFNKVFHWFEIKAIGSIVYGNSETNVNDTLH
ncbi:hypothetical protein V1477_017023 [Vespula maculifrons]|uniref:Uncharacterized protein n=1 Tax=Vespula maculifrons TaxID=7453 RepID=A0ABD2B4T9_VESMC